MLVFGLFAAQILAQNPALSSTVDGRRYKFNQLVELIMLKIIIICFIGLLSTQCHAGYLGSTTAIKMYGAGNIHFGVENGSKSNTCDNYGRSFKFDATTEAGKNMLSILLSASLAGKKVDLWFTDSTTPGTDQTNGCVTSTMATLTSIGLS